MSQAPLHLLFVGHDEREYQRVRDRLSKVDGNPFRLEWITGLHAAIERLQSSEPDLCVLDGGLGKSEGVAAIRQEFDARVSPGLVFLEPENGSETDIVGEIGEWEWDLIANELRLSIIAQEMIGCVGLSEEAGPKSGLGKSRSVDPETWFEVIDPRDVDQVRKRMAAHLEGVTSRFEADYRVVDSNGNSQWLHSLGLAEREESGTPFRLSGSHRRLSEESLAHFPQGGSMSSPSTDQLQGPVETIRELLGQLLDDARRGLSGGQRRLLLDALRQLEALDLHGLTVGSSR